MTVAVVTSSTSDLAPAEGAAAGIGVVPLTVSFGSASFLAGEELTAAEFWTRMTAADAPFPTTAAASPGRYRQAYDAAFGNGADAIVVVDIAEWLSATIKSARIAADMLPDRTIRVVDTGTASMGVGILALMAADMAAKGHGADEIAATLERRRVDIDLYVLLDTLEYLRKGGRISGPQATIGTLLSVKPIITVRGEKVEVADRPRTHGRGRERVLHLLTTTPLEKIAILYSPPADPEAFRAELIARVPGGIAPADVTIHPLGPSIGPHIGPGALGAVILRRPA